jgi:hypothetical protein
MKMGLAYKARSVEVPEEREKAISRPFAIAIRAARLYTAWLRYRM